MGVPCPGCGRSYDVTLFAFGRTLHCACGERVGLAHRLPLRPAADPPRFLADAMLGRLARWLRLLGFDTAFEAHVADEALVRRALREGRAILTRDRALPAQWRVEDVLVLRAATLRGQLREVLDAFALAERIRPLTRCSVCNGPLRAARPDEVAARVPPRVLAAECDFRACPDCGRVYWRGSHTERILHAVDALTRGS